MSEPREVSLRGAGGDPVSAMHIPADPGAALGRGVVLAHEVFGLDAFILGVGQGLARAGYEVLIPDLYSREGLPGPAGTPEEPAPRWEPELIRAAAAGLPDRRCTGDLEAAGKHMLEGGLDPDGLALLGFCRGGTLAFLAGCQSRLFQAVILFYGRLVYPDLGPQQPVQPLEMALNLEAPLLGHFGSEDPSIPAADVDALEERLAAFAKTSEIHRYSGAQHGFANPLRPSYSESDTQLAWDRTYRFLEEVL